MGLTGTSTKEPATAISIKKGPHFHESLRFKS